MGKRGNRTPVDIGPEYVTDEGVTVQCVEDDGAIGYRFTAPGMPTRYLYLNASMGSDTGDVRDTCAFLYLDEDLQYVETVSYINIWERDVTEQ